MTPDDARDRHDRIGELFLAAGKLDAEERAAFLARECAGDDELRAEVESLLAHDDDALHARAGAAIVREARELEPPDGAALPDEIGGYRVLRRIGQGGMGVVYEAEQAEPLRRVALKVIRPGFVTEATLRRFRYEAQVLGWLDHPGIARVYEAGTEDDGDGPQPWFAMELVEGEPLNRWTERHAPDLRARLALLAQICDAVHHAHQKGVIHRDLKPANVLVDAKGQPKVLDFGVARVTDHDLGTSTLQTLEGELIGTLPYMSPEQIEADPSKLDVRSDVYALGVVAYELLSGRLPHDLESRRIAAAARAIVEDEPSTLGALDPRLRGDVETIVGKAIEKDVTRRYASAEELASDIRRHLGDEPIQARPPSAVYQLRKFARRNRGLVGGAVAAVLVLIAATAVSVELLLETRDALEVAEDATDDANDAREAEQAQREAAEDALARAEEAEALATRNADAARAEAFSARQMNDFLLELFLGADPGRADGLTLRDLLDRGAATIGERFADKPEVRADFSGVIGLVYKSIGAYDEAEVLLEDALRLTRERGEPGDDFLGVCLVRLGSLRLFQGRLAEAVDLFEEALDLGLELEGVERTTVLQSMRGLARALVETGRPERAEAMAREVLRLVPGTPDIGPTFVRTVRQTLGAALREQGDDDGALEQLELIMGDLEAAGEERSAQAAFLWTSLADMQLRMEDFEGAAQSYRVAEDICAELEPEEGPPRWIFSAGVGRALEATGDPDDLDEAALRYEEAIAAKRASGMSVHPYMGTSLRLLARVRLKQERPAEALDALTEALVVIEETRGATHPDRREVFAEVVKCLRLDAEDAAFAAALDSFRATMIERGHEDELEELGRLSGEDGP